MKSSFVFLLLALTVLVPASALAFRPAPGDQLALSVQHRALRMGDRGEGVASLQELLRERGFEPGPVDGIFGPLTLRAVERAQKAYRLTVDGLAGRLTVGALRNGAPPTLQVWADSSGLVVYQAEGAPAAALSRSVRVSPALPGASAGQAIREFAPEASSVAAATPSEQVNVALTFNGLPDETALDRILEALGEREMQATFFVLGEEAEARPDLVKRLHEAGHEVASLGFTALDMRRLSPVTARALLRRTERAITEATGVAPAYFRPPLGLFDRHLNDLAEAEGLRMVLWSNVTVRPVPEMEADRLAAEVASSLFPGAVLMLPMDRPNATAAVAPLLEQMEVGGYRSRTLSSLTGRRTGGR
ncbi:MAG: polysaccharide deacetylase family protein [Bacillota bacterium]